MCMQNHNDTIIKTSEDFFRKICTSHFICKVACEWELEAEQRLQYIDAHSYGYQRCVFLVLLMFNRRPGGSALCWVLAFSAASCLQRVSKLNRGSRGPLLLGGGFLYHNLPLTSLISNSLGILRAPSAGGGFPYHIFSPTRLISNSLGVPRAPSAGWWLSLLHPSPTRTPTPWLPVFTELYNSSVAHSIFGIACLLIIKRKQLSCSSQVTLFLCISLWMYHGLLPCPISSAKSADAISSHNCHRNVSLPSSASLWNSMFGRVEGQYTTDCKTTQYQPLVKDAQRSNALNISISKWSKS